MNAHAKDCFYATCNKAGNTTLQGKLLQSN